MDLGKVTRDVTTGAYGNHGILITAENVTKTYQAPEHAGRLVLDNIPIRRDSASGMRRFSVCGR